MRLLPDNKNPMPYVWKMNDKIVTGQIIGAAMKVHSLLGPGLLESAYENCLCHLLLKHDFVIEKQKALPLVFENIKLDAGYRIDILVNHQIIVEVKSVDTIADIHVAQILTYLKLSEMRIGLLINFNTLHLKDGIRRFINSQSRH
jgi:GxxExxY protein